MQKQMTYKGWITLLVGIMTFLASPFLIAAQTEQPSQPEPQPDIKFEERGYNFGSIEQGEKVVHVFMFKNEGTGLLKIGKVKTSCGCTVPKTYTKEVPPDEEGQIEVIFNSKNFLGNIKKTIYVNSNDPDEPVVNLALKGTITAEVVVIPPQQLLFGLIRKGQPVTKGIMIKQAGSHELKILKVEADLPFISTKLIPQPQGERKNYRLEVTIAPDAPEGIFQGMINIHTNMKKHSLIKHKVNGIVKSKAAKP